MTDLSPHNILRFPKKPRKLDCQGERSRVSELRLIDRLTRIRDGLEAGMTTADVQNEYDAQQAERIVEHWVRQLANNSRRGPSETAAFLGALVGRLNGQEAS